MAADARSAIAHVQLVDGYRFPATFPDVPGAAPITLDAIYEDFCIVTESVRKGIPVNVHVARCGEDLKRVA